MTENATEADVPDLKDEFKTWLDESDSYAMDEKEEMIIDIFIDFLNTRPAPSGDRALEDMLIEDNQRMRKAGLALAEAALNVIREYDGTHRLSLAVSEWSKAIADEGDRGERYAALSAASTVKVDVNLPNGWDVYCLGRESTNGYWLETRRIESGELCRDVGLDIVYGKTIAEVFSKARFMIATRYDIKEKI